MKVAFAEYLLRANGLSRVRRLWEWRRLLEGKLVFGKNNSPSTPALSRKIGRREEALVFEVTATGEDHRNAMLIASGNDFVVFPRATRLYDSDDAGLGGDLDAVGEGEKGVRS